MGQTPATPLGPWFSHVLPVSTRGQQISHMLIQNKDSHLAGDSPSVLEVTQGSSGVQWGACRNRLISSLLHL